LRKADERSEFFRIKSDEVSKRKEEVENRLAHFER